MSIIDKFKIVDILGAGVLLSYYLKFRNAEKTYSESKYWYGLNKSVVTKLIPLQLISGISYLVWFNKLKNKNKIESGFLKNKIAGEPVHNIILVVYHLFNIGWTITLPEKLNTTNALINCSNLWIVSICSILLQAGTFENSGSDYIDILSSIFWNTTIVLIDGIGWSANIIRKSRNID